MHVPLPKRNLNSSVSLSKQIHLLQKEKHLMEPHNSPKTPFPQTTLLHHQLQIYESHNPEIFMSSPSHSPLSSSVGSPTMNSTFGSTMSEYSSSPSRIKTKLTNDTVEQLLRNENCIVLEQFFVQDDWFQMKLLPQKLHFGKCKEGSVYSMKMLLFLDCKREGILLERKDWLVKIGIENVSQFHSIQNKLYHAQIQVCIGQIVATGLNRIYVEVLLSSDVFHKLEEEWLIESKSEADEILKFENEITMNVEMDGKKQQISIPISADFISGKFYEKYSKLEEAYCSNLKSLVGNSYKNYFLQNYQISLDSTNQIMYLPTSYSETFDNTALEAGILEEQISVEEVDHTILEEEEEEGNVRESMDEKYQTFLQRNAQIHERKLSAYGLDDKEFKRAYNRLVTQAKMNLSSLHVL